MLNDRKLNDLEVVKTDDVNMTQTAMVRFGPKAHKEPNKEVENFRLKVAVHKNLKNDKKRQANNESEISKYKELIIIKNSTKAEQQTTILQKVVNAEFKNLKLPRLADKVRDGDREAVVPCHLSFCFIFDRKMPNFQIIKFI